MSKGVWMTADQVRRLTEGLVSIESTAEATDTSSASAARRLREIETEADHLRRGLPDFDNLPDAGEFWEACREAAWRLYVYRYGRRMDGRESPEYGAAGWVPGMIVKYGAISDGWPLPGFPTLRATLDVARLVGQCEGAWGWEESRTSGERTLLNSLVEFDCAAESAGLDLDDLGDFIFRLCLGCMGEPGGLGENRRWRAWCASQEIKPIPMDVDGFGLDWLPKELSDCGVPVREEIKPAVQAPEF